ncbi:uncharacterized protein VNE69_09031 [Vairimorpha necatrix]|uniref:Uncharacterized protein n=1 Tax=Vairimorpha necatrix TaxID=6039 RepID=A0AAX4JFC1_9MICR
MKVLYLLSFCWTAQNLIRKVKNMVSLKKNKHEDMECLITYESTKYTDDSDCYFIDIEKGQHKSYDHQAVEYIDEKEK